MANITPMKFNPLGSPITHWENTFGFPLFHRLSHELDAMFDLFGIERPASESVATTWTPLMEMFDRNESSSSSLRSPPEEGRDHDQLTDSTVVVLGERRWRRKNGRKDSTTVRTDLGHFYRIVALPDGARFDLAKATLKDGVLEITMPLAKVEEKATKLEIVEPTPPRHHQSRVAVSLPDVFLHEGSKARRLPEGRAFLPSPCLEPSIRNAISQICDQHFTTLAIHDSRLTRSRPLTTAGIPSSTPPRVGRPLQTAESLQNSRTAAWHFRCSIVGHRLALAE